MSRRWAGPGWAIETSSTGLVIETPDGRVELRPDQAVAIGVRIGWFRRALRRDGRDMLRLRRLSRSDARDLDVAIRTSAVSSRIAAAVQWASAVRQLAETGLTQQRWIPTEAVDTLLAVPPDPTLPAQIRRLGLFETLTDHERSAVEFQLADAGRMIAETNERIVKAELRERRSFFDTIEKSPLTEEQARAVICFDNRVQLLAAAGSGKTSVMVARAAYAVSRGFVAPERILLLAFNKAAATELQERVADRFAAAGIDATGVRASTFHSFGLGLLGRVTGEKPRLASWLDQGNGEGMVMRIVDELCDSSMSFRYRWDLYRLLMAPTPANIDDGEPDGYDKTTRRSGFQTFGGDVVKSHGERLIADFLYLNGVAYEYERPYEHHVADAEHSQYRPDFYYPDIGAYHEHWGLERDGNPPADFVGYAEAMRWKQDLHRHYGTRLIETTWTDVVWGDGLEWLGDTLKDLGLELDWNPDRAIRNQWAKPVEPAQLARLVRTCMSHVKSNSWARGDLEARLVGDMAHLRGFRTRLFLDLYWAIHEEWQRRLAADGAVDFEDMLVRSADVLAAGAVDTPYDLILVDEFQDASRARARLVQGLVREPSRYLLAVGDDWQAINRFAGADLSVMTDFETWFGRGQRLALTTTFRCPQSICDVANRFVSKNPGQFRKSMRSAWGDQGSPVLVLHSEEPAKAIEVYLDRVSQRVVAEGGAAAAGGGKATVNVLGRYGWDRDLVPRRLPPNLEVTFRTVHGSKGLEADYVVLPNMTTGRHGFPSTIADDPVLGLAMPTPDAFPHAEERRLFYVALTRARREVTLIGPPSRMSPFVVEVMSDPGVQVIGDGGRPVDVCPTCGKGTLRERTGPYSTFLGCTRFPACRYTQDLSKVAVR